MLLQREHSGNGIKAAGAKAVKKTNNFQGRIKDVMLKYIPYISEILTV